MGLLRLAADQLPVGKALRDVKSRLHQLSPPKKAIGIILQSGRVLSDVTERWHHCTAGDTSIASAIGQTAFFKQRKKIASRPAVVCLTDKKERSRSHHLQTFDNYFIIRANWPFTLLLERETPVRKTWPGAPVQ